MKKPILKLAIVVAAGIVSTGAYADSIELTNAQMDGVAAGGSHTTTGFVCPVIKTAAVLNAKNAIPVPIGDGVYSILGPNVTVPVNATNWDGAGEPFGDFASPGDAGYTAIWNTGGG